MLIYNRIVRFSSAIERILIRGIRKYFSSKQLGSSKEKIVEVINSAGASDSSIGPFLDVKKAEILKKYAYRKKFTGIILMNESVAYDIVSKILPSQERNKCIVVEANSDLGLITVNLIKFDVHHIFSFVNSNLKPISMTQLVSKYPDKITVTCADKAEKVVLCAHDFYRNLEILYVQGLPVILLAIVKSLQFITVLTLCFLKFNIWENNVTVYLVVPEKNLKFLKQFSSDLKLHIQCLFNIMFKVEKIANYPSTAFLSNPNSKSIMTLIKITRNPNYSDIISKNDFDDYFIFLHVIGGKGSTPIIEILESWIPKCGPYLISKGISPCNTVGDLSFEELIVLFKILKNFEGFQYFKISTSEIYKDFLTKF